MRTREKTDRIKSKEKEEKFDKNLVIANVGMCSHFAVKSLAREEERRRSGYEGVIESRESEVHVIMWFWGAVLLNSGPLCKLLIN